MSRPGAPADVEPSGDLLYFFLSYARLGPLPDNHSLRVGGGNPVQASTRATEYGPGTEADPEVQKFFEELDAEIVSRTQHRTPAGFIPLNADPREALAGALSRAQVFVPLYSPNYLNTSWTRSEQKAFRLRMRNQHYDPDARTLPVLWTPVPPWTVGADHSRPLEQARTLAPDVGEYSENGLRALCMLPVYSDAYHRMLEHIAAEIIRRAESDPVPPEAALDLGHTPETPTDPSFVITVLTGQSELTPKSPWHPYSGRQEPPVADYAVRTAERFGLAPLIVDFGRFSRSGMNHPVLAIVDPRILRQPGGEDRLRQAFRNLPIWVRPLVVGDSNDPTIDALTRRAQDVLSVSVPASSDPGTRSVERVDGPRDFEAKLPIALAKTRQDYLRYGSYDLPPSLTPRPRLTSSGDDPTNGRES